MNERYRAWGIVVTVLYALLAVPIVLSSAFFIIFSYMGSDRPWGSYVLMGPPIILAVFIVIMSMFSIRFADIRSFFKMEITLLLMLVILLMFLVAEYMYCIYALIYSLTGILQIRKFWRYATPEVSGKHLKWVTVVMLIPLSISCASLAFGVVKSTPKMPAEFKGIKFTRSSLHFYDDWSTRPSMGALAEAQEVQGIRFPKYTFLFFDESGRLKMAQIREGAVIQGVHCVYGQSVYFDKTGRMEYTILPEDQVINGKLYRAGISLKVNEDGSLEELENIQGDY